MIRVVILVVMVVAVVLAPRYVGDRVRQFQGNVSRHGGTAGTAQAEQPEGEVAEGTLGRGVFRTAEGGPAYPAVQVGAWQKSVAFASTALRGVFRFCQDRQVLLLGLNWLFLLGALAVALGAFLLARYTLSRRSCQLLFAVGAWELAVMAVMAVLAHLCRINFFAAVPAMFWITPVVFVLMAAGSLRRIDMNYPFWNETLRAVFVPVLAGVLVLEWDRIAVALHRLA